MRPQVAARRSSAGARLVNDVSGGQADPTIYAAVAELGVPYVCMHWRGHSDVMQSQASYTDVVSEVIAELGQRTAGPRWRPESARSV